MAKVRRLKGKIQSKSARKLHISTCWTVFFNSLSACNADAACVAAAASVVVTQFEARSLFDPNWLRYQSRDTQTHIEQQPCSEHRDSWICLELKGSRQVAVVRRRRPPCLQSNFRRPINCCVSARWLNESKRLVCLLQVAG